MDNENKQTCLIQLQSFTEKASQLSCKVIGTIKTVLKDKKYIIEVSLAKTVVIRSYKSSSEFEALYQLIVMKYKHYPIEKFPSKYQIIGKEETRKKYYENLLNKIIKDHSQGDRLEESSRRLLSIIYLFLSGTEPSEEKKPESVTTSFTEQTEIQSKRSQYLSQNVDKIDESQQASVSDIKHAKQSKVQRKQKMSCDEPADSVILRPRCSSMENEATSSVVDKKFEAHEFDVKFSEEDSWKKRYLIIKGSVLFLFSNRFENYFRTSVELYGATVEFLKRDKNFLDHFCEKMEFNVKRTFNQNTSVLSIYHQHDFKKIQIRKPANGGQTDYAQQILEKLKEQLEEATMISPVSADYSGVFNPIGKLFIFLHKLNLNWPKSSSDEMIHLLVKTDALSYQSRPIVYAAKTTVHQGFLIPISSPFETIKIECAVIIEDGWVKQKKNLGKVIASYTFSMTDFLTNPNGYLIDRVSLNLESLEGKAQKHETTVEVSIENFSDFSSIYSDSFANQHDGKPLNNLNSLDNVDELKITVDRVLRVLGNIALFIQAFWRNVYLFKYPRLGFVFFTWLAFNAVFLNIGDVLKQILVIVLLAILYQQKHVNLVVRELMDKYIFSHIHPNFKAPLILSTRDIKYLKWSQHLQYMEENYRMVEGRVEKNGGKSRQCWQFEVHGNIFRFKEEEHTFFEKMREARKVVELIHRMISSLINTIEKMANLFSWVDAKRTIFIMFILFIFSGIASDLLIRSIILLFCIHRFVKGSNFYKKKHYAKNRRLALHCMQYIMYKHFPSIIGERKERNLGQLDQFLSELVFPIHDESSHKKLKLEMDKVMGVYLDPESLYSKDTKKSNLKLGTIIDMVESCQSRLKLRWISGPEGISNEFQNLKTQCRQVPVFDIWLKESLINFLLNMPSQLYTTLNKKKMMKRSLENSQKRQSRKNSNTDGEIILGKQISDKKSSQNTRVSSAPKPKNQ